MNYCIVENGIIINIIVCENDEIASKFGAVPSYEGANIGDKYNPPVIEPSNKEKRELAYETEKIINYEGELITVDEANKKFWIYLAEGNEEKVAELTALILEAKNKIREMYPD